MNLVEITRFASDVQGFKCLNFLPAQSGQSPAGEGETGGG